METGLTFGGRSAPWILNLFAEALHWVLQSNTAYPVEHYLDDFFGVIPASADPGQPLHALALACSALGLQLAPSKTSWNDTRLEFLGVEVDTVQQTVGGTPERRQRILAAIDLLLSRCSARLLDWQRVAGLLQFVSQVMSWILKQTVFQFEADHLGFCSRLSSTQLQLQLQTRLNFEIDRLGFCSGLSSNL